jgi:hypothetical protein
MWGLFFYLCVFLSMCTCPCVFSINAFYKVNVACDCLCLGFHFFNKGSYAMCGVFVSFPIWRQSGIWDIWWMLHLLCILQSFDMIVSSEIQCNINFLSALECFCLLICILAKVRECTLHLLPNLCVNFVQVGAQGNRLTMVKPNSYNINDSNLLDWFIM